MVAHGICSELCGTQASGSSGLSTSTPRGIPSRTPPDDLAEAAVASTETETAVKAVMRGVQRPGRAIEVHVVAEESVPRGPFTRWSDGAIHVKQLKVGQENGVFMRTMIGRSELLGARTVNLAALDGDLYHM